MESTWRPSHLVLISYWVGKTAVFGARPCQQGTRCTAQRRKWEARENTFWCYSWLQFNSVQAQLPCSQIRVLLSVWQTKVFYSCVIFCHKGESSNMQYRCACCSVSVHQLRISTRSQEKHLGRAFSELVLDRILMHSCCYIPPSMAKYCNY